MIKEHSYIYDYNRLHRKITTCSCDSLGEEYIVTCQDHPALVKQVHSGPYFSILVVSHQVNFVQVKDPWSVSRCCLEPRWFTGDPTLLARDNILVGCQKSLGSSFLETSKKRIMIKKFIERGAAEFLTQRIDYIGQKCPLSDTGETDASQRILLFHV